MEGCGKGVVVGQGKGVDCSLEKIHVQDQSEKK